MYNAHTWQNITFYTLNVHSLLPINYISIQLSKNLNLLLLLKNWNIWQTYWLDHNYSQPSGGTPLPQWKERIASNKDCESQKSHSWTTISLFFQSPFSCLSNSGFEVNSPSSPRNPESFKIICSAGDLVHRRNVNLEVLRIYTCSSLTALVSRIFLEALQMGYILFSSLPPTLITPSVWM